MVGTGERPDQYATKVGGAPDWPPLVAAALRDDRLRVVRGAGPRRAGARPSRRRRARRRRRRRRPHSLPLRVLLARACRASTAAAGGRAGGGSACARRPAAATLGPLLPPPRSGDAPPRPTPRSRTRAPHVGAVGDDWSAGGGDWGGGEWGGGEGLARRRPPRRRRADGRPRAPSTRSPPTRRPPPPRVRPGTKSKAREMKPPARRWTFARLRRRPSLAVSRGWWQPEPAGARSGLLKNPDAPGSSSSSLTSSRPPRRRAPRTASRARGLGAAPGEVRPRRRASCRKGRTRRARRAPPPPRRAPPSPSGKRTRAPRSAERGLGRGDVRARRGVIGRRALRAVLKFAKRLRRARSSACGTPSAAPPRAGRRRERAGRGVRGGGRKK